MRGCGDGDWIHQPLKHTKDTVLSENKTILFPDLERSQSPSGVPMERRPDASAHKVPEWLAMSGQSHSESDPGAVSIIT